MPGRVTPELHAEVLARDRVCIAWRMDHSHQCRDGFGTPHRPDDKRYLTVDHVHLHYGGTKGKRAPHRRENLVAACHAFNGKPPSKDERDAERSYLLDKYPGATCCDRRAA